MKKKAISYLEAKYLKHTGKSIGVKVTISIVDGTPEIHMRDYVFPTFQPAILFLRHVAEAELGGMPFEVVRP